MQTVEFEPVPFETWLSQQEGEFEKVDCRECDGSGQVECECVCGHEHEKECRSCEGEGKVSGAIDAYWKQVKIDRKRWEQFIQSSSPAI